MKRTLAIKLAATVLLMFALASCVAPPPSVHSAGVTPHPQAGKFVAQRDADHPILAFYGGVGLRKMPDGRWNGYDQQSPDDVQYLIRRMRENGMTRIYASFQEENYPSKVIPRENSGIDYVDLFIKQAHQNNIEVYGDISCFGNFIATCQNFTHANPDCFTRDVNGNLDSHMLSPAYEKVHDFKRSLLREYMSNYPIDGIALDFIRYPYYSRDIRIGFGRHGYDEPALQLFRERFGYDKSFQPAADDPRWIKVKTEFVTRFIRQVREDVAAAGLKLPIAVFNSITYGTADSYRTVHQDPQAWEEQGLVNEHAPMLVMTSGMANLAHATNDLLRIKRAGSHVMGAIFLDAGFQPDRGYVPTPTMVKDAARRLIKLGCDGLWFCRASEIEQYGLWPTVREISGWSIKQIRSESFDPLYEDLFAADDWTSKTLDQPPLKLPLQIALEKDKVQTIERSVQFGTTPHLAVDSLLFKVKLDLHDATLTGPIQLKLILTYADGAELMYTMSSNSDSLSQIVKAECDFDKHILMHSRCAIVLPTGSGRVQVQSMSLFRDPLVNSP